jgi:hypothetical protein
MTELVLPAAMVEAAARKAYERVEVATSILTWDKIPDTLRGREGRERWLSVATEVLAAALGVCEVREEYAAQLTYADGQTNGPKWWDRDIAVTCAIAASPKDWAEPGPPGVVLRRLVIWTPAEEVPNGVRDVVV